MTGFYKRLAQLLYSNSVAQYIDYCIQSFIIHILKTGELPNHVAFIMDGNRRFAKNNGLPRDQGHEAGSLSLTKVLEACYSLEIKHISIYAFSIENFNRSPEEVQTLFDLLIEKLNFLIEHGSDYNIYKAQIRIIGNKSLIPKDTLDKLEKIEEMTKDQQDIIINVCFAYTSRDEIAHSISKTIDQTIQHDILIGQINKDILKNNFYFKQDTPKVDILIRTSGHTRLSDYLIWQVNENSNIEFLNVFWPDFNPFHYYLILLKYGYTVSIEKKIALINEKVWGGNKNSECESISIGNLPPPPPFVSILGEKN